MRHSYCGGNTITIRGYTVAIILISAFLALNTSASAEPGRIEEELSGDGWKLWLDQAAEWRDDDIFPPPVDLDFIPVNFGHI